MLRLKDGSIRVPVFQRPLKWKREDNRLFFDSLLKSYPVGSLLMWAREAPAALVKLGPFTVDVQGRLQAWEVVDGQQRLTALAASLLPVSARPAEFDFVVDVETGDVASPRGRQLPQWIPLEVLADTEKLIPFLHANASIDVAKASALSKRLREYPLSISILETDEQAFVEDVFRRLNTAGKRLTTVEVFRGRKANQKHGDAIARAAQVGNELQFGELDESNLLRAYKALAGKDPLADEPIEDEGAGEALVRGASEAVAFLKQSGVPIVELLPYSLPAGVLVAYFGKHREVLPRNRQLLGYWFWRATFTLRTMSGRSEVSRLLRLATLENQSAAVTGLLQDIGNEKGFARLELRAGIRTTEGKLLALTLADRGPRHVVTGERLDVNAVLWRHKSRAFQQVLRPFEWGLVTSILHPPMPRAALLKSLSRANSEVLASHELYAPFPEEADDNYFARREEWLDDYIERFADRKRGDSDSLRPPLSALEDPP